MHCKFYSRGICKYGDSCNFKHDISPQDVAFITSMLNQDYPSPSFHNSSTNDTSSLTSKNTTPEESVSSDDLSGEDIFIKYPFINSSLSRIEFGKLILALHRSNQITKQEFDLLLEFNAHLNDEEIRNAVEQSNSKLLIKQYVARLRVSKMRLSKHDVLLDQRNPHESKIKDIIGDNKFLVTGPHIWNRLKLGSNAIFSSDLVYNSVKNDEIIDGFRYEIKPFPPVATKEFFVIDLFNNASRVAISLQELQTNLHEKLVLNCFDSQSLQSLSQQYGNADTQKFVERSMIFFIHEHKNFKRLVSETATYFQLSEAMVLKDYFTSFVLYILNQWCGYNLYIKGGYSLVKCFRSNWNRMSEDVDVRIEPSQSPKTTTSTTTSASTSTSTSTTPVSTSSSKSTSTSTSSSPSTSTSSSPPSSSSSSASGSSSKSVTSQTQSHISGTDTVVWEENQRDHADRIHGMCSRHKFFQSVEDTMKPFLPQTYMEFPKANTHLSQALYRVPFFNESLKDTEIQVEVSRKISAADYVTKTTPSYIWEYITKEKVDQFSGYVNPEASLSIAHPYCTLLEKLHAIVQHFVLEDTRFIRHYFDCAKIIKHESDLPPLGDSLENVYKKMLSGPFGYDLKSPVDSKDPAFNCSVSVVPGSKMQYLSEKFLDYQRSNCFGSTESLESCCDTILGFMSKHKFLSVEFFYKYSITAKGGNFVYRKPYYNSYSPYKKSINYANHSRSHSTAN